MTRIPRSLLLLAIFVPGARAETGPIEAASIGVLIMLSGLFSGLTLGLMGLDKTGLEIVMGAGSPAERKYAKLIAPVRANGNLLLCTLLLGNVAVNALLSIIMADLAGGMMGFLVSTGGIVIIGEIVPQASCARHALLIGARSVPLVKLFIVLMYPIAKPISMVLDWALGEEAGTIHSRKELMKLLQIHVTHGAVDTEQGNIMTGAITFKDKHVRDVMTFADRVFFLSNDDRLNFKTISAIFRSGYSRIPVCGRDQNDIVGVLFTKDLIFVDPEDDTPVRNFIQIFGRSVHKVWPDAKLDAVLKLFKKGKGHLAVVHDVNNDGEGDPFYEVKGIITLEDIIEEILQDEIVDETDVYVEIEKNSKVMRETFDYARLRMLDARLSELTLTADEASALTAHLCSNYEQFQVLKDDGTQLSQDDVRQLILASPVLELERKSDKMAEPLAEDVLYKRGRLENHCTIVLTGHLSVRAGSDGFVSEAGPWSVLAADALLDTTGSFTADFTAVVASDKVKIVRVSGAHFQRARRTAEELEDATRLERKDSVEAREHMQHNIRAVLEGDTSVPSLDHRGRSRRTSSSSSNPDQPRSRTSSLSSDPRAPRERSPSRTKAFADATEQLEREEQEAAAAAAAAAAPGSGSAAAQAKDVEMIKVVVKPSSAPAPAPASAATTPLE